MLNQVENHYLIGSFVLISCLQDYVLEFQGDVIC